MSALRPTFPLAAPIGGGDGFRRGRAGAAAASSSSSASAGVGMSLYEVLGVAEGEGRAEEIKRAYRRMARRLHPDAAASPPAAPPPSRRAASSPCARPTTPSPTPTAAPFTTAPSPPRPPPLIRNWTKDRIGGSIGKIRLRSYVGGASTRIQRITYLGSSNATEKG
uniref:J domain-containing protein n=1 Tax=Ananas comosus var. bracteatus TaxID=296719 RepID=A0A6V7Q0W0_ANACO|nr:unnamed protein product [Ananas comosus var. bracteatus]